MAAIKKNNKITSKRLVRSLLVIITVALLMGFFAKVVMNSLNKKMGIDTSSASVSSDSASQNSEETYETVTMPEFDPSTAMDISSSVWVPDWKPSLCSLYVTMDSDVLYDSLPEAPTDSLRRTELQLLIELWADHAEFGQVEIEQIWVFTSGDTCFIDLPKSGDWNAIAETIKGRFVAYSLLIPFVSGEIVDGLEDGIQVLDIFSTI